MEVFEALLRLAERDPLSFATAIAFGVFWFSQRNSERDDRNVSAALTLTTTIISMFQPLTVTLEGIASIVKDGKNERVDLSQKLVRASVTMADVTRRRDAEHQEIIARMNQHQNRLDKIAKDITVLTDLPTLRGETAKLLLLATEMSRDVKSLLLQPQANEPGEHQESKPESSESKKEVL